MSDFDVPTVYPDIPLDELPCISCMENPSTHRTPDGYPVCDDCHQEES